MNVINNFTGFELILTVTALYLMGPVPVSLILSVLNLYMMPFSMTNIGVTVNLAIVYFFGYQVLFVANLLTLINWLQHNVNTVNQVYRHFVSDELNAQINSVVDRVREKKTYIVEQYSTYFEKYFRYVLAARYYVNIVADIALDRIKYMTRMCYTYVCEYYKINAEDFINSLRAAAQNHAVMPETAVTSPLDLLPEDLATMDMEQQIQLQNVQALLAQMAANTNSANGPEKLNRQQRRFLEKRMKRRNQT